MWFMITLVLVVVIGLGIVYALMSMAAPIPGIERELDDRDQIEYIRKQMKKDDKWA